MFCKLSDKSFINKCSEITVCLFLFIFTLTVYWQIHAYGFINFDDNVYITQNRHIKSGLTIDSVIWAFTTIHASNWHPLTWLSHMIDYQMYGLNPGAHHLSSLFLHIANSLLLFFVFKKMTGKLW
jgi:protein O-mannosyl-transferase